MKNPPMGVLPCVNRMLMLNTRPRSCSGEFSWRSEFAAVAQVIPAIPVIVSRSSDGQNEADKASAPSNTLNAAPLISSRGIVILLA